MLKTFALMIALMLTSMIFGFSEASINKTDETRVQDTAGAAAPGSRCTRLLWKELAKSVDKRMMGTRCSRSRPRQDKFLVNTPPSVELKASLSDLILPCPDGQSSANCKTVADQSVTLDATATDAEKDAILYTFSTTGGRIAGEGSQAVWSLAGVASGTYTATVEVDDGCGCIAFNSASVNVAACEDCQ